MRKFKRIRKHLDQNTAISVANAIVRSRIDYCNSFLFVLPDIVCSVTKSYKYPSITKIVRDHALAPGLVPPLFPNQPYYLQSCHLPTDAISSESSWNERYSSRPSLQPVHQPIPAFCGGECLVPVLTQTTLPKFGMYFSRAYVLLGRFLLSARPLRPITAFGSVTRDKSMSKLFIHSFI